MTKPHRKPYVKGGVASLRQPFFLGKIAKKIKKGVKKVVKSPLGKLGALAAGAYFAPTLWGGAPGAAGWGKGIGALRSGLLGAATGATNTAIGGSAGVAIVAGAGNVCLGYSAGPTTNQSNQLWILMNLKSP